MHQLAFHPEMNRNTIIHLMLRNQDKLLLYGLLGSDKQFFFSSCTRLVLLITRIQISLKCYIRVAS